MEIRDFISFKKVVEEGSFSKAAESLGYAQSTISSHIQSIESFYGKSLFNRIGNQVSITQFGSELLNYANKLLGTYDELKEFKHENDAIKGTIRIGAPESLMMYRLYDIIYRYKKQYPQVEIVITTDLCSNLRKKILSGDLDFGIILQPILEYNQLIVKPLKQERFCLIAPKEYSKGNFIPEPEHLVIYTEKECTYREVFASYLLQAKFYPTNILETSSVEAIKKYVIHGLGISYVPRYSVEEEIKNGDITAKEWHSDIEFYSQIIFHKNKWMNAALSKLIYMIEESAASWK